MAVKKIGIRWVVDDASFKTKMKQSMTELKKFNDLTSQKAKLLRDIMSLEAQDNSLSNRKLQGLRQYNQELAKQTRMSGSRVRVGASGGTSGGIFGSVGSVFSGIGGTLGMLGGGLAAINQMQKVAKFESGMTSAINILGINRGSKDYKALQGSIFDIARSTNASAGDIQGAMTYGLSSGLNKEQAKELATTSGYLSTGSDMKASEAAQAITTIVNTFGLATKDIAGVADKIVGTMNVSVGSAETVVSSLSGFMAGGKNLGFDLTSQLAAFSLTTQKGYSPDEAATMLNNLFTTLQDVSSNKALLKAGVTSESIRSGGLGGVLDTINKFTSKMSIAEKDAFMSQAFANIRGSKSFTALQEGGSQGLVAAGAQVNAGDAMANAARNANTLSNKFAALQNEILGLSVTTGEANGVIGKLAMTVMTGWTGIFQVLNDFANSQTTSDIMGAAGQVFSDILKGAGWGSWDKKKEMVGPMPAEKNFQKERTVPADYFRGIMSDPEKQKKLGLKPLPEITGRESQKLYNDITQQNNEKIKAAWETTEKPKLEKAALEEKIKAEALALKTKTDAELLAIETTKKAWAAAIAQQTVKPAIDLIGGEVK